MFIFNRYYDSFNWKNQLNLKKNLNFFNFFYNHHNNAIHYSLLISSFSFIFYFFSPIMFKNIFSKIVCLNSFLLFFVNSTNKKSPNKAN